MSSLVRAFLSSSLGTALSRLSGLARDLALTAALGADATSDAVLMAWRIPGVIRRFIADEGLTGALIPGVANAEAQDGDAQARRLAEQVLGGVLLTGMVLSAVGILAAPWLVDLFAGGYRDDPEKFALTVALARIMTPLVITVSVVSWAEGLLNHRDHFFWPKLAPALINVAMVVAALWPTLHTPLDIAHAVAWSVLVGGVTHVLVCLPPLVKRWGWLRPRFDGWREPRFTSIAREMGKVVAIGIMAQINIIVLGRVASFLPDGSFSQYFYATRIVDVAQGIIAVGVGSAMLPLLSRAVANAQWDDFERSFVRANRLAAVVLLPSAAFLTVLSLPTVAVLFGRGRFDAADVQHTANALTLLVPYMLSLAAIQLLKKPFFALDKRNELVLVGGLGVIAVAALGGPLSQRWGVEGLSAALSASTALQAVAYLVLLRRHIGPHLGLAATLNGIGRISLACLPAAAAGWGIGSLGDWSLGPTPLNLALLAGAGLAGGLLYTGAALALGVDELRAILRRVLGRFGVSIS